MPTETRVTIYRHHQANYLLAQHVAGRVELSLAELELCRRIAVIANAGGTSTAGYLARLTAAMKRHAPSQTR